MRRKNYLIKKGFQFNFLASFVILLIVEIGLLAGYFFYVTNDTVTTGYIDSILRVESTQTFFLLPYIWVSAMVALGIALTGMVIFTLLSHRIAGPLFRFEKVLKQLETGDFSASFRLRRSDQFREFETSLNNLTRSLDQRLTSIKNDLKGLRHLLAEKDDPKVLPKIHQRINLIEQEISHFKVSNDRNNGQ